VRVNKVVRNSDKCRICSYFIYRNTGENPYGQPVGIAFISRPARPQGSKMNSCPARPARRNFSRKYAQPACPRTGTGISKNAHGRSTLRSIFGERIIFYEYMISDIGGIPLILRVAYDCDFLPELLLHIIFLFQPRRYNDFDDCPVQKGTILVSA
jgi:hypothetical protein